MSIRRINSTGRMKILREDARFFVRPNSEGILRFDATLKLDGYELPSDAHVYVEAYRQTTFMRFPHGTAAHPEPPANVDRRLTEFASPDGMLFRVKVTSTGDRDGVLLADGDRIPISADEEQPDNRIPLLPPAPADLGQEVWRVDGLDSTSGPMLLVNSKVSDWKAVAASPLFRSLVYSAAMRQVLWYVYKVDETRAMDDIDDWRCRWLMFASALPGVVDPPLTSDDDAEWEDWINTAVESFARQHKMLEHYKSFLAEQST
jgi:hypothetical protein